MPRFKRRLPMLAAMTLAALSGIPRAGIAGDVEIEHASFRHSGGSWSVDVTLRHADTGWDHYADAWRVVGADGSVLGTRTLYHPHENEQPFTRSLGGVMIPDGDAKVYVEAHDKVHGWSRQRLEVDLGARTGKRFEVSR